MIKSSSKPLHINALDMIMILNARYLQLSYYLKKSRLSISSSQAITESNISIKYRETKAAQAIISSYKSLSIEDARNDEHKFTLLDEALDFDELVKFGPFVAATTGDGTTATAASAVTGPVTGDLYTGPQDNAQDRTQGSYDNLMNALTQSAGLLTLSNATISSLTHLDVSIRMGIERGLKIREELESLIRDGLKNVFDDAEPSCGSERFAVLGSESVASLSSLKENEVLEDKLRLKLSHLNGSLLRVQKNYNLQQVQIDGLEKRLDLMWKTKSDLLMKEREREDEAGIDEDLL